MTVYVVLLRNINVGGHPKFAMADLRTAVAGLGYTDVRTYIQTGNVLLTASGTTAPKVAAALEKLISAEFGVKSTALVRTATELATVARTHPFAGQATSPSHLHVTFLADKPSAKVDGLDSARSEGEQYRLSGSELYLYCPNGYGRSKLNNALVERRLGVAATTRNWNSVTKLAQMASSAGGQ